MEQPKTQQTANQGMRAGALLLGARWFYWPGQLSQALSFAPSHWSKTRFGYFYFIAQLGRYVAAHGCNQGRFARAEGFPTQ